MPATPPHILLLDDDEGILLLARKALERAGYRVSACLDPVNSAALIEQDLPDLLVLDYHLNAVDSGLDFFRSLLARGRICPAILVTGFTDESRVIEALRAGVADVVPKAPGYLGYLPEAVERVLTQERLKKQSADAELLRDRELHYRTLSEALPHLVWTARPDGSFDFLSKQWLDYTGLPEAQQLGVGWHKVLHADDLSRIPAAWLKAVAGHADYDLEFRMLRHDGVYRWFRARGVPVRDRDDNVTKWFGTCTDVNDQRRAAEEREQLLFAEQSARLAAEEANQAKDQFLAMLSHELRTPLTPALASARMLERAEGLPVGLQRDVQMIRRNVELEAKLIDDLLDLTRVANGKLLLSFETVEVHEMIDAVLEMFDNEIHAKRLSLDVHYEAAYHHVKADRARLQQMLWNLIKNAVKFTPEGGQLIIRTGDLPKARIEIKVQDSGIGIEAKHLGRLFTAFEQGQERVGNQFGGLGLGLAITKALTEVHGGAVWAESPGRDRGATFTLVLGTAAAPLGVVPTVVAPIMRSIGGLRILLIEDHTDTAEVMTRLIEEFGHQVELARDLREALAAIETGGFDLALSDIGLPDGTGLDFVRALRRVSAVPAVALTGFGMEEDIERCLQAGFNVHLTKPVNFDRLQRLLDDYAAQRTASTN